MECTSISVSHGKGPSFKLPPIHSKKGKAPQKPAPLKEVTPKIPSEVTMKEQMVNCIPNLSTQQTHILNTV